MEESLQGTTPPSGGSVFLHDLSIRLGRGVAVPVEHLDPEEVLGEAAVCLGGSLGGKLPKGAALYLAHTPHKRGTRTVELDPPEKGRFFSNVLLRNGANHFTLELKDRAGEVFDSRSFTIFYKSSFREWNETIFIAFFLALMIRSLVVQAFWIPTGSMEPTLLGEGKDAQGRVVRSGDRILVNRFAYAADLSLDGRLPIKKRIWFSLPKRGDIIVFRYPDKDKDAPPRDFIKRVIGLPGDHIEVLAGKTYVNGVRLVEPYIAEEPVWDYETVVPDDALFVMGDNRNNSADSRVWGPMPLENLKGQAIFAYMPTNRIHPIRSHPHALIAEK